MINAARVVSRDTADVRQCKCIYATIVWCLYPFHAGY